MQMSGERERVRLCCMQMSGEREHANCAANVRRWARDAFWCTDLNANQTDKITGIVELDLHRNFLYFYLFCAGGAEVLFFTLPI